MIGGSKILKLFYVKYSMNFILTFSGFGNSPRSRVRWSRFSSLVDRVDSEAVLVSLFQASLLEELLGALRLSDLDPLVLLLDVPHLDEVVEDGGATVAGREAPLEVHVVHIPVTELHLDWGFGKT